jgi:hypothetical protein
MRADHNRPVTPASDPERWHEEEAALFNAGKCSWQTEYGMRPLSRYCGETSRPGASFGYCGEHESELLEAHFPDGTPRRDAAMPGAEQEADR